MDILHSMRIANHLRIAVLVFMWLAVICTTHAGWARAAAYDKLLVSLGRQANKHTAQFLEAEKLLRAQDPADWSDQEVLGYFSNALWAVFSAVQLAAFQDGHLPDDLRSVVDAGIISAWPGNPFNNWEPMKVNASGSEFSAGDLTLQLCPPEYYSFFSNSRQDEPLSFEIGVFGRDLAFASDYGSAKPNEGNAQWAKVPQGTLYMIGTWTESANSARAKRDKVADEIAAAKEASASASSERQHE